MSFHNLTSMTIRGRWLAVLACAGALAWLAVPATAQRERPAKISGLTATVIGDKQVRFTWDEPKDARLDRYAYRFHRRSAVPDNPDAWDQPWKNTKVSQPAKATSWVWTAPAGDRNPYGTYYFNFRVRAGTYGWSFKSELVTVELTPKK